jgi:ribonuclease HI
MIKKHDELELFTDSLYVKNGVEKWMKAWKENKWKNAAKKPVANQDLWLQLDELLLKFKIRLNWTRGHADDEMNNRCDKLARGAANAVL